MTRDRAELQTWYRQAMARRIEELRALRGPLQAEEEGACDRARAIGQALRGSGATFGFPDLTAVAALLETSVDRETLRRVEGLIAELFELVADGGTGAVRAEWLLRAADLPLDASTLDGVEDMAGAWARVVASAGLEADRLAEAVGRYLDLDRADLSGPGRSALRLVPEALVAAGRVVPLEEDGTSIVVATCEPTSLPMELELKRVTGRTPVFEVAPPGELDTALAALLGPETRVAAGPVRPALEEKDLSGRGVLVVDDEPSTRFLIRSLLERRGFEVFEAGDGVEALALAAGEPAVGLVVADLNMPRMDGLELIWELRRGDGGRHLPVIVVTGEADELIEAQLLEEGADDYIRKPLDSRLFLARVEATMRRHEG